jgi:NADH-quinone oxidoreductase subunit J
MEQLHLLLCIALLFCGLMAAFSVNPVESVLFLILAFCISGSILFIFNAEFLGLLYIIVYVGAVAVLFLFIIMMLNVKIRENLIEKIIYGKHNMFLFILFFSYPIFLLVFLTLQSVFAGNSIANVTFNELFLIDSLYNIDVFGQVLYNNYVIYFLFAGIVLLVALVGSIVLTLRFNKVNKSQIVSRQLSRTDRFLSYFK